MKKIFSILLATVAIHSTTFAADLSLQRAIDLALTQNSDLKITQKQEDVARANLKQAQGGKKFSVSANSSVNANKTINHDSSSSMSNGITASLPIYSGGRLESQIESSEIGVKTSELATERQRETTKLEVIQAYYNALEAKRNSEVDQETVDNYSAHLENVTQLYTAGATARIDVIRSNVELSNARQTLIQSRNSYEVNLAQLRNLIGIDRTEPLNLTDDLSEETYAIFNRSLESCTDYAHENRKDLLSDQFTIEQRELAVKIAKANYKPSINANAGASWGGSIHPSGDWDPDLNAGISASWNIFDSGVTRAEIESAEAELEVANLTYKRDLDTVDLNLRTAYLNMREAEARFNSTGQAVHQAEEDYFIAREKYRVGEGLLLDIIDAQLALSTAKKNAISARYDYARYKAEVENLMGIGLTDHERGELN